jgi:hypothetical protein
MRAVETGVHRSQEEIREVQKARSSADDLKTVMYQFRQDIIRGSNVHDYPAEYLILSKHPPVPDLPHTPVKLVKKLRQEAQQQERHSKMDSLVGTYMERYEGNSRKRKGTKPSMSKDEYYRRLLGVQAAKSTTSALLSSLVLMNKSVAVQLAYNAAVHHYQLVRNND